MNINKRWLILICILALSIRILAVLLLTDPKSPSFRGRYPDPYHEIAVSIEGGNGFSIDGIQTIFWPPLYPYFLASLFKIGGTANFLFVRIIQAFLNIATLIILWALVKNLLGRKVADITFFICCFYPAFIYYTMTIDTEILYFFCIILTLYFMLKIDDHKLKIPLSSPFVKGGDVFEGLKEKRYTSRYCFLSGLSLGLATLCRPITFVFAFGMLLWLIIFNKNSFYGLLKKVSFFIVGIIIVIFPWTARNYSLTHKFIPLGTSGGYNFLIGITDQAVYETMGIKDERLLSSSDLRSAGGILEDANKFGYEEDAKTKQIWINYIKKYPLFFAKLIVLRFLYMFNLFILPSYSMSANVTPFIRKILQGFIFYPILIFGILGTIRIVKDNFDLVSKLSVFWFLIIGVLGAYSLIWACIRYRIPIADPYFIMCASYYIKSKLK